ncbi:MAG: hypothetical protein ACT4TC_18655 [Myxococcaceae bacterium]
MRSRFIEILFPVRPGERRLTTVLFAQSFLSVGAFLAGRTARDALFLSQKDSKSLAWI